MRKIGNLTSAEHAGRLQRYLAAQGIDHRVEPHANAWELWVIDEDQVPRAKEAFEAFLRSPESPQFDVRGPVPARPAPPKVSPEWGRRSPARPAGSPGVPLTILITALSASVSVATRFGAYPLLVRRLEMASSPALGLSEILHGELWRLITPIFLHFSLLHLGFNIYMFWILSGAIERIRGSRELLWITLAIAVISDLVQFVLAGPLFGGLSGVVYGLFGFIWMRSVFLPEDGFYMPRNVVTQMLIWAFLCLSGALGPIANGAHFGGLFAGMALGALPRLWRD